MFSIDKEFYSQNGLEYNISGVMGHLPGSHIYKCGFKSDRCRPGGHPFDYTSDLHSDDRQPFRILCIHSIRSQLKL